MTRPGSDVGRASDKPDRDILYRRMLNALEALMQRGAVLAVLEDSERCRLNDILIQARKFKK